MFNSPEEIVVSNVLTPRDAADLQRILYRYDLQDILFGLRNVAIKGVQVSEEPKEMAAWGTLRETLSDAMAKATASTEFKTLG